MGGAVSWPYRSSLAPAAPVHTCPVPLVSSPTQRRPPTRPPKGAVDSFSREDTEFTSILRGSEILSLLLSRNLTQRDAARHRDTRGRRDGGGEKQRHILRESPSVPSLPTGGGGRRRRIFVWSKKVQMRLFGPAGEGRSSLIFSEAIFFSSNLFLDCSAYVLMPRLGYGKEGGGAANQPTNRPPPPCFLYTFVFRSPPPHPESRFCHGKFFLILLCVFPLSQHAFKSLAPLH